LKRTTAMQRRAAIEERRRAEERRENEIIWKYKEQVVLKTFLVSLPLGFFGAIWYYEKTPEPPGFFDLCLGTFVCVLLFWLFFTWLQNFTWLQKSNEEILKEFNEEIIICEDCSQSLARKDGGHKTYDRLDPVAVKFCTGKKAKAAKRAKKAAATRKANAAKKAESIAAEKEAAAKRAANKELKVWEAAAKRAGYDSRYEWTEAIDKERKYATFSNKIFQPGHNIPSMSKKEKTWVDANGACESCRKWLVGDTAREFEVRLDEASRNPLGFWWRLHPSLRLALLCQKCADDEGLVSEKEKDASRSRRISEDVRDAVWNRDGGKCVQCGSNEDLEFDHIIPFSKGGANTKRNIQLLCESCNRKKSDKIG